MAIKDGVVSWFIQNVVIPRGEIIDQPGFVINKVSGKNGETYLRDIMAPERLFIELEKTVGEKFGKRGEEALYAASKKFSYAYGRLSSFQQYKSVGDRDFSMQVYFIIKYLASLYAGSIDHRLDLTNKAVFMTMRNYVVCSSNGKGIIFSEGAVAGIWAYLMNDENVEAVQTECQGRKDKACQVLAAPAEFLEEQKLAHKTCTKMQALEFTGEYKSINEVRKCMYAQHSLRTLLDSNAATYTGGVLDFNGERLFHCDYNLFSLLESEGAKLKGWNDLLFKAAFEAGETQGAAFKASGCSSAADFLGAVGFGDVNAVKQKGKYALSANFFPWSPLGEKTSHVLFRGLASGLVSAAENKKVTLRKIETNLTGGFLQVLASE